jgi:hypothetical protein
VTAIGSAAHDYLVVVHDSMERRLGLWAAKNIVRPVMDTVRAANMAQGPPGAQYGKPNIT